MSYLSPTIPSATSELVDEVWQDIVAERDALLAKIKGLEACKETLEKENGTLRREVEVYKTRDEERGRPGTSSSYSGSRVIAPLPSRNSFLPLVPFLVSSPPFQPQARLPAAPPTLFDRIPNETLHQILGHLHQPFHFFHYSNALNGIWDPPVGSRPWNPVGLQLVNRRWRDVAKSLFYKQVAFDTRDTRSIELAVSVMEDGCDHPLRFTKLSVLVVRDSACLDAPTRHLRLPLGALGVMVFGMARMHSSSIVLRDRRDRTSLIFGMVGRRSVHFALGSADIDSAIDTGLEATTYAWRYCDRVDEWPDRCHPNHLLVLRLPLGKLSAHLDAVLNGPPLLRFVDVPRLQLDFPFRLTPTLLDTIFPTLTSILQHPSLPAGRDFILRHTGNPKRILFGAQSNEDATELRKRIDALGELEVEVEVVVLEL